MLYMNVCATHLGVILSVSEKLAPLSDINRCPDGAPHIHTQLPVSLHREVEGTPARHFERTQLEFGAE